CSAQCSCGGHCCGAPPIPFFLLPIKRDGGSTSMRGESLRTIAAPFVAVGPSGVAIRTRLGHLSAEDEEVLRLVGTHLGSLASKDLKRRCADGLEHSTHTWAG